MQRWGYVHAATERFLCEKDAGGQVRPGCSEVMGLGEWMGGRFSVDLVSKVCDRERDVRVR